MAWDTLLAPEVIDHIKAGLETIECLDDHGDADWAKYQGLWYGHLRAEGICSSSKDIQAGKPKAKNALLNSVMDTFLDTVDQLGQGIALNTLATKGWSGLNTYHTSTGQRLAVAEGMVLCTIPGREPRKFLTSNEDLILEYAVEEEASKLERSFERANAQRLKVILKVAPGLEGRVYKRLNTGVRKGMAMLAPVKDEKKTA
jgi:hypothetical protein